MSKKTTEESIQPNQSDQQRLLTPAELADMLGIPIATLYAWRYHGKGPTGVRIGKHLRYRRNEVDAWIAHSERDQGRRR